MDDRHCKFIPVGRVRREPWFIANRQTGVDVGLFHVGNTNSARNRTFVETDVGRVDPLPALDWFSSVLIDVGDDENTKKSGGEGRYHATQTHR